MRHIAALLLLASLMPVAAQHQHRPAATPYAGFDQREMPALTPAQLDDLRAGRGAGMALPAELNGYPGPMHVLEHAAALELTAAQRGAIETLMHMMHVEAIAAGAEVIAAERVLNALFAETRAAPETVREASTAVGAAQARLRSAHLVAHIGTRALLNEAQRARYDELRGYRRN
jgi:hypothetical protein